MNPRHLCGKGYIFGSIEFITFREKNHLCLQPSGLDRNAKNHLAVLSFLVNEGRPLLSPVIRISERLYIHIDSKPTSAAGWVGILLVVITLGRGEQKASWPGEIAVM